MQAAPMKSPCTVPVMNRAARSTGTLDPKTMTRAPRTNTASAPMRTDCRGAPPVRAVATGPPIAIPSA